jgi:phage protein U
MMALGPFRFSIDSQILLRIERRYPLRYADQDLMARAPGSQFLGPGLETIQLPCVVYPLFLPGSGLSQIEDMRQTAARGESLMLAAGTGRVLGRYTIRNVDDTRDHIIVGGIAQKIDVVIDIAADTPVAGGSGAFSLFG